MHAKNNKCIYSLLESDVSRGGGELEQAHGEGFVTNQGGQRKHH